MARLPDTIRTARLRLARWSADDAVELRSLLDANDAHLRPWIPFMQHEPRTLAATRAWLGEIAASFDGDEHYRYAIRLPGGECVGETMLIGRGGPRTHEAGYWLAQRHCGHGYSIEATAALIPLAFDRLGDERVILCCDERNLPSMRVAEKLGGNRTAIEHVHENGVDVALAVYEIRAS